MAERPQSSQRMYRTDDIDESPRSSFILDKELAKFYIHELSETGPNFDEYPGTETIEYDFTAERASQPWTTNIIESIAHLIKGCLGAGVLAIHEGFMHGGIWTSLAGTAVIGLVVSYNMLMLVKSAQKMYVRLRVSKLSYPDLAEAAVATGPRRFRRYSKSFRHIVDALLFVLMCGSCCLFEIMMARTLKQVAESFSEDILSSNMCIRMYILIVSMPLLLICSIRSLKYLAPFSVVADVFVSLCVIATIYYSIQTASQIHERPGWKSVQGLFRFLGVCIYSVEGISMTLPIENCMKKPRYFPTVLQWAMTIVVGFVAVVGFFGYWGWGEKCQTPITIHIPVENTTLALQFLLAVMMGVTFAIHFFVPFRIIWHYLAHWHKRKRGYWERLYRVIHVVVITCVAIAFPNSDIVMSVLGSVLLAFVGFIFPALIEALITWTEDKKECIRVFIKDVIIMIFGSIVCGGAFYSYISS